VAAVRLKVVQQFCTEPCGSSRRTASNIDAQGVGAHTHAFELADRSGDETPTRELVGRDVTFVVSAVGHPPAKASTVVPKAIAVSRRRRGVLPLKWL
jgi:hypothetical protein